MCDCDWLMTQGGPVATHMKCCPAHLNSCPTSTRTMKNPLPWQKKVMWKIRPRNQGAVLAQGGSWTRGGGVMVSSAVLRKEEL